MQKILILGSTGMLGLQVLRALQELKNFKIYATYKDKKKKLKLKNLIKINNSLLSKSKKIIALKKDK